MHESRLIYDQYLQDSISAVITTPEHLEAGLVPAFRFVLLW